MNRIKIAIIVLGLFGFKVQAQNVPLELKINNKNICMEWMKGQNDKADMFLIEKSHDGVKFESIGIKEVNEDSHYSFCDLDTDGSRKFYRIMKIESKNGKMNYDLTEVNVNPYSETAEFMSTAKAESISLFITNQFLTSK